MTSQITAERHTIPVDDIEDRHTDGRVLDDTQDHVSAVIEPMLSALFRGALPIRFEMWDGSHLGPEQADGIRINSAAALRRIVWAPNELGFARAFICGDIDLIGSAERVLRRLQRGMPDDVRVGLSAVPITLKTAWRLGAIGLPPPPPPEESTVRGIRHSIQRDKAAIAHHYDVGNEFYELVLGPSMTYSCARFAAPDMSLAAAQASKHELICRKLGLAEPTFRTSSLSNRPRLLDVGCGWGEMAIHAARHHDVDVVGVTTSTEQAHLARRRVDEADLTERVEIRVQDYRDLDASRFDAISSIGMAEHVGRTNMSQYFEILASRLRPGGRVLNHAISSVGGSRISQKSFVGRYVFPDGELLDLSDTVTAMQGAGFEVRDIENLREHYAMTLRSWVANLERDWEAAVRLVGEARARVWQLYMSGSINGFDDAGLQLHQTLGVKHAGRPSDVPRTRVHWETP